MSYGIYCKATTPLMLSRDLPSGDLLLESANISGTVGNPIGSVNFLATTGMRCVAHGEELRYPPSRMMKGLMGWFGAHAARLC